MLLRLATLVSQIGNVILLNGQPDVTISARCYVNRDKPRWRSAYRIINKVFFFQDDHCKRSFDNDIRHARSVIRLIEENRHDGEFW